jgi:hypothetical protein
MKEAETKIVGCDLQCKHFVQSTMEVQLCIRPARFVNFSKSIETQLIPPKSLLLPSFKSCWLLADNVAKSKSADVPRTFYLILDQHPSEDAEQG